MLASVRRNASMTLALSASGVTDGAPSGLEAKQKSIDSFGGYGSRRVLACVQDSDPQRRDSLGVVSELS